MTPRRAASMRTFVLVHGGGHGGWCYRFVAERLRAKGHAVFTPTMTGLGERSHLLHPAIDLNLHIEDIVKVLEFEDLSNVILVGHSYGGTVIVGVADHATTRVGHLVYLDAPMPQNGKSLADVVGARMLGARQHARVIDGVELVLFPEPHVLEAYGVKDPALLEWMKSKLTPHPWRCFEQKLWLTNEAALRKIPQSQIVCTATLPGRDVAGLKAASQGRFWDIDSGHDLMITEPDAVTELLLRVAAVP